MVLEVLTYIATGITALLLIAVAFFSRQLRDWKTVLSIPRSDTLRTVIIVSLSILAILVSPFALFAGLLAVTVQGLSQRVEPDPHRPPPRYQLNLGAVLAPIGAFTVLIVCLVVLLYHFFTGKGDPTIVTFATTSIGGIVGLGAGARGAKEAGGQ